jgi:hypothetical protein
MAHQRDSTQVDLKESSVHTDDESTPASSRSDDIATDAALDRLESITGGADEPAIYEGDLGKRLEELEATTEEEVDALRVNLYQEDDRPDARNGSGLIVDDPAEERIARLTESDPIESDAQAESVEPGLDDTSAVLRRHQNTSMWRSDGDVEGNVEVPMDEAINDRTVE